MKLKIRRLCSQISFLFPSTSSSFVHSINYVSIIILIWYTCKKYNKWQVLMFHKPLEQLAYSPVCMCTALKMRRAEMCCIIFQSLLNIFPPLVTQSVVGIRKKKSFRLLVKALQCSPLLLFSTVTIRSLFLSLLSKLTTVRSLPT